MSLPLADLNAFLGRIVACPDDPLPRLVFADWLDEAGGSAEAAWAARDAIQVAINHHYSNSQIESVDSIFYDFSFESGVTTFSAVEDSDMPLVRLTNLVIWEAIRAGATAIDVAPGPDAARVRHRVDGVWVERDPIPLRLLTKLAERTLRGGRSRHTVMV